MLTGHPGEPSTLSLFSTSPRHTLFPLFLSFSLEGSWRKLGNVVIARCYHAEKGIEKPGSRRLVLETWWDAGSIGSGEI